MRVLVLSDTHLRSGIERLPAAVHEALARCDAILHAGDVVDGTVLDALGVVAPVHAVLGNNDHELVGILPEEARFELGGVRVAMVHDSGPKTGRAARLAARFPEAQLVVYGHSHVPSDEVGVGGQLLFNPGSPTQRRRQPRATYGELVLEDGTICAHRIATI